MYKPHLFPRKIAPKAGVRLIYGNTAEIDEDEYDRLFGESDNEEFDGF